MRFLKALWAVLRELSGEAALERRLASRPACGHTPAERVAAAIEESYVDRPRCC